MTFEEFWKKSKERSDKAQEEWEKKSPEEKKRLLNDPLYHRMVLDTDEDVLDFTDLE